MQGTVIRHIFIHCTEKFKHTFSRYDWDPLSTNIIVKKNNIFFHHPTKMNIIKKDFVIEKIL